MSLANALASCTDQCRKRATTAHFVFAHSWYLSCWRLPVAIGTSLMLGRAGALASVRRHMHDPISPGASYDPRHGHVHVTDPRSNLEIPESHRQAVVEESGAAGVRRTGCSCQLRGREERDRDQHAKSEATRRCHLLDRVVRLEAAVLEMCTGRSEDRFARCQMSGARHDWSTAVGLQEVNCSDDATEDCKSGYHMTFVYACQAQHMGTRHASSHCQARTSSQCSSLCTVRVRVCATDLEC